MTLADLHLEAAVRELGARLRSASGYEAIRLHQEAAHLEQTLRQGGYASAADEARLLVTKCEEIL